MRLLLFALGCIGLVFQASAADGPPAPIAGAKAICKVLAEPDADD
jgi:hypothetical protein